eukprot:2736976-Rhodomonas_salina.2
MGVSQPVLSDTTDVEQLVVDSPALTGVYSLVLDDDVLVILLVLACPAVITPLPMGPAGLTLGHGCAERGSVLGLALDLLLEGADEVQELLALCWGQLQGRCTVQPDAPPARAGCTRTVQVAAKP